jgi:hypothetical protein
MIASLIRKEIQYNRIKMGRSGKGGDTFPAPHAGSGRKESAFFL